MKYNLDTLLKEKGLISKEVAARKKASKGQDKCEELIEKSKACDKTIAEAKAETVEVNAIVEKKLGLIGNIVGPDVVISETEDDNKVIRTWGEIPKEPLPEQGGLGKLHHHEIMQCLDILEMDRGARIAGHRGYYLKGAGVLLNQALINYGIATLHKKDYTPIQPPYFMKKSVMESTCQLSDFAENLYEVNDENEPCYLTATSE